MCGVLATREDEQAVNLNPQFVLAQDTLAGLFLSRIKSTLLNTTRERHSVYCLPTRPPCITSFKGCAGQMTKKNCPI